MTSVKEGYSKSVDYDIKTEDGLSLSKNCFCKSCDFASKTNRTLQVHVEMNHIKRRYFCSLCDYKTKEKYVAKNHIVSKHGGDSTINLIHQCGICGEKSREKESEYLKHIAENHQPYFYIYKKRRKKYVTRKVSGRIKIKGSHHSSKTSPPIQCEFCSATFKELDGVRLHVERIHMKLVYQCEQCEFKCRSLEEIRNHFRDDHNIIGYKKFVYKCNFCPVSTKTYNEYCEHFELSHKQLANLSIKFCDKCDEVKGSKIFLAKHNRIVHLKKEREKKFMCPKCNFSALERHKLELHFETHTKPKFTCKLCLKNFNARVRAAHHVRKSHKGSKDLSLMKAWWMQFVSVFCSECCVEENMHDYEIHLNKVHNMPKWQVMIKKNKNKKLVKRLKAKSVEKQIENFFFDVFRRLEQMGKNRTEAATLSSIHTEVDTSHKEQDEDGPLLNKTAHSGDLRNHVIDIPAMHVKNIRQHDFRKKHQQSEH